MTINQNGSTCIADASHDQAPVYLRNFGNVLLLVDVTGKQVGVQTRIDTHAAVEGVQTVTVTLAHQGFWHEGLAKDAGKATADEIKAALRMNVPVLGDQGLTDPRENLVSAVEPQAATSCVGFSIRLDPLESAIDLTVRLLGDEHQRMLEAGAKNDTVLCDRLGSHLDALLAEQLKRAKVE